VKLRLEAEDAGGVQQLDAKVKAEKSFIVFFSSFPNGIYTQKRKKKSSLPILNCMGVV
jgi:hypothetical protein